LLGRLGDPHHALPPVFHVAGTNGKGSVCAFLRAMLEAQGWKVHVAISPHLVRYNERIRLAGRLIGDGLLAELLGEVLDTGDGLQPSFFEVTIAATYLAFARIPADACVVEVGLGGRFDATNVLDRPAVCGIAALGLDHERFLLAPEQGTPSDPLTRIAFEKAGIAKRGVPLVVQDYPPGPAGEMVRAAARVDAPLIVQERDWGVSPDGGGLRYHDRGGELRCALPSLAGRHQLDNAGLAIAMLRHQQEIAIGSGAIAEGLLSARWPARLQRLAPGPLAGKREVWLDGGHNPSAAEAIAAHFAGRRLHGIIGMIAGKRAAAFADTLRPVLASLTIVPVPYHESIPPAAFDGTVGAAGSVREALEALPDDGAPVLICGSLYLAGEVLRLNGETPD
jgi:dihydrofolate synthase/folylpolyglutamate synthase